VEENKIVENKVKQEDQNEIESGVI